MHITEEANGSVYALPSKEINLGYSPLAIKILHSLAKKPSYPKGVAQQLRVHEQKVYYHIRNLERRGLIKVIRKEERGGSLAKIYSLEKPSFFMKFAPLQKTKRTPKGSSFMEPFILDGKINAKIIVGSPDPHGPEKVRSRDAYYAIDLGLFLGTFLVDAKPAVYLDTDLRHQDLKDNLIIVGGPVINKVSSLVNDSMPIRFDRKKNIFSAIRKKTYKSDDCGLVVKMRNPYDPEKKVLVIAGKRYSGTRAAILAFIKNFEELQKKNYSIVEGIDSNYDGIIDDVRIVE